MNEGDGIYDLPTRSSLTGNVPVRKFPHPRFPNPQRSNVQVNVTHACRHRQDDAGCAAAALPAAASVCSSTRGSTSF